jgi:GNAT superfamily N-acetyltransferase
MMASSSSIEISTLFNPYSDRAADHAFSKDMDFHTYTDAERKARVSRGISTRIIDRDFGVWENIGERLQRIYSDPKSTIRTPEIDEWYHNTTTWMSPKGLPNAQNWWYRQFKNKNNSHLEAMPKEWWRLRTRNLFVARDKANRNKPVGVAALTMVYMSERDPQSSILLPENTSPWCYEIRAEVVDGLYRGQGLGKALTRAALLEATLQQPVMGDYYIPSVAVTNNPVAAHIFEELGATDKPYQWDKHLNAPGEPLIDRYDDILCWSRFTLYSPNTISGRVKCSGKDLRWQICDTCPKTNKVAWWWPTQSKELMGKLEIFHD